MSRNTRRKGYFVREEKTGRVAINNISCLFYKILEI